MERNLTFDLLHDLVNMAVQYRYGTETLDIRQGLFTVIGSPTPIGIDGPQWNVRIEHNRSAGRAAFEIVLEPLQLFVTERPMPPAFKLATFTRPTKCTPL